MQSHNKRGRRRVNVPPSWPKGEWTAPMSKRDRSASVQGIETRHERKCRSRNGGRCDCNPTYRAFVFDKRANRKIRRTFPNRTPAKLWRQDALIAMRRGEIASVGPTSRTVRDALNGLIAGMEDGSILDRSGRRYRPATIRGYETAVRKYPRAVVRAWQLQARGASPP